MKTKYSGVYLEENGTYTVKTSFRTKDKIVKQITKRGFETAKKANTWKEENKVYYKSKMAYELEGGKTPVENLVEQYLKYKKLKTKQRTIDNITYTLNKHFTDYFKSTNINDLTTQDIAKYYEYIANLDIKNQSKNIIIVSILDAMEFFDIMEMVSPEIVRRFKRILVKFEILEGSKNDYLENDEIKLLLNTFDDAATPREKMDKLMIYTFIYSGLRKSELLALNFKDIDFIKRTIKVKKQVCYSASNGTNVVNFTKTNQNKEVVIPSFLVEMFLEYMQIRNANGNDIIFISKHNTYLPREYANKVLKAHLEMANLKQVKVHDLRHTFCTMLYDLGAEEQFVAQQMGHSSPNTSHLVYEHLTKDRLDKNKDIIENIKI